MKLLKKIMRFLSAMLRLLTGLENASHNCHNRAADSRCKPDSSPNSAAGHTEEQPTHNKGE